jgi:hypothetical protein
VVADQGAQPRFGFRRKGRAERKRAFQGASLSIDSGVGVIVVGTRLARP